MASPLVAVLISGHEYHPSDGTHWERCCLSREKFLARRHRTTTFFAITFDVSAGRVRKALYRPNVSAPFSTSYPLAEPIRADQYKSIPGTEPVPFKRLDKIMSITDIYAEILKILADIGGKIAEMSFFSHAYADGPILTNTWAFQRVVGDGSAARLVAIQQISSSRDDADLDPRMQDFMPGVQSAEALTQWRTAFAPEGYVWIWGCNKDEDLMRLMRVVRRAAPPISAGSSALKTVLVRPRPYELESINKLSPNLLVHSKRTGGYEVSVGALRRVISNKLRDTYAQSIASATGRRAYAAGPGTYAEFRNGADLWVPPVVHDIVQTYRSSFGVSADREGLHYLEYKPQKTGVAS